MKHSISPKTGTGSLGTLWCLIEVGIGIVGEGGEEECWKNHQNLFSWEAEGWVLFLFLISRIFLIFIYTKWVYIFKSYVGRNFSQILIAKGTWIRMPWLENFEKLIRGGITNIDKETNIPSCPSTPWTFPYFYKKHRFATFYMWPWMT